MAILERLRRRTGWTIGGAPIPLIAWFVIPPIGQRLAVTDVTPPPVTPRGYHQVGDGVRLTIFREGPKVEVTVTLVGGA